MDLQASASQKSASGQILRHLNPVQVFTLDSKINIKNQRPTSPTDFTSKIFNILRSFPMRDTVPSILSLMT